MFWFSLLSLTLAEIPLQERTNGPRASLEQLAGLEKRIDLDFGGSSYSSTQSEFEPVFLQDNQGWYPFTFGPGNAGFYALQSFFVFAGTWGGLLSITDCFCAGDQFIVTDYGLVNSSPRVFYLTQCDNFLECEAYAEEPQTCFESRDFCKVSFELEPGRHNITIQVVRSIWLGGTGYVKYQAFGRCGGIECELKQNCVDGIVSLASSHSCCSSDSS